MGIMTAWDYKKAIDKRHIKARKTKDKRGVECPSWLHAEVSNRHIDLEDEGKIYNYRREVAIRLTPKCEHCGAKPLVYTVDFVYEVKEAYEDYLKDETVYVEPKGAKTPSYRKRERQWRKTGPGRLEVWAGRYRKGQCEPYIAETIFPKEPRWIE